MDYKQLAAQHAVGYIQPGQVVGVGAGNTVLHLLDALHDKEELCRSLRFITPCIKTYERLQAYKMNVENPTDLSGIDWYFDGCDQVDAQLNALKSGGGIHSGEKIMASMAAQFVILADTPKFVQELNNTYPLCIEVMPGALSYVIDRIKRSFLHVEVTVRRNSTTNLAIHTVGGNYLIDARFTILPELPLLDNVKMIPGVIDHSLFFQLAAKAFVGGPGGVREYQ